MTTDALLAIAIGVVIPFALALAGGALAIKALPNSEFNERITWIGIFVFLCLVGVGLSFYQQIRFTKAQTIADQTVQREKLQQEGEVKYTQGELDSINKVLGQVVSAGNSGTQTIAKALLQGALSATSSGSKGVEPPAIEKMTNQQLRTKVIGFVNALRAVCTNNMNQVETVSSNDDFRNMSQAEKNEAWQKQSNQLTNLINNFNLLLEQQFVGDSTVYRDELLRRLGPQTPLSPGSGPHTWWEPDGTAAVGYWQALATADYLESLAKRLPQ
jgi:hypothetical protein